MGFLVTPKDVWVVERFTTEWAHQPHSKVHFPHMGTDGCPWGSWALFAALNLALIDSFGTPSWILRGCMSTGRSPLRNWDSSCWGRCNGRGLQDLRLQVLRSLEETAGELGNGGSGRHGMVEVVKEEGGNTRWLPSRVCRNPPPRIPWQPPLISPTPQSQAAELWLLTFLPLPSLSWHIGVVSHPVKKDERANNNMKHQRLWGKLVADKVMRDEKRKVRKKERETYLCQQSFCFLFLMSWVTPQPLPSSFWHLCLLPEYGAFLFPPLLLNHLKGNNKKKRKQYKQILIWIRSVNW